MIVCKLTLLIKISAMLRVIISLEDKTRDLFFPNGKQVAAMLLSSEQEETLEQAI